MSIHFDYGTMLEEAIGDIGGLSRSDIEAIRYVFRSTRGDLSLKHASGKLPFFDLPFDQEMIEEVDAFAMTARSHYRNLILMGIGGSALGPIALHASLNHLQHNLLSEETRPGVRFFCPDNVDPDYINSVLDVTDPNESLYNVVSKSGGTAETVAQFLIVVDLLKKRIGRHWKEHLILTTDPMQGLLRKFATEEGIKTFDIPSGVGGRFCLLTPVGLLPAALTGINIKALCAGARAMKDSCFDPDLEENLAAMFAGLLYLAQVVKGKPIHVMFAYSNRLYPVADWFRQLWAESLGKQYSTDGREIFTGPTPVKAIGATDQHSQVQLYVEGPADKAFIFLGAKSFQTNITLPDIGSEAPEMTYLQGAKLDHLLNSERKATAYALASSGKPVMSLELDAIDAPHIGALMYLLEAATLYGGGFYRVNPLDQPGVEAGKKATYALMGREGYEDDRVAMESFYREVAKKEIVVKV